MKTPSRLKVALVHDYIKEFGGAEAVLEELSEIFPHSDIYTSLYCPGFLGPHKNRLAQKWQGRIHQSFFRFIPFAHKIISPLRLLSPLAFHFFDFSGYDLIISSATGAYFPNSLNKKTARLYCYCHTPPRYLYGLPTARHLTKNRAVRILVALINHFLRLADFRFAQNVDTFIANSKTTAQRIQKFYRRDAVVINPPVEVPKILTVSNQRSDFFLTGGRLARAKRYDVAIKACNSLGIKLKVFGRDFANYESELKQLAGPTVEFLGEISQAEKNKLLSQAKAFIFCSDNEDFGIAPVEAMAHGCPVVAYKSGGTMETVINGRTGVFFNQLNPVSCAQAIKRINRLNLRSQDCINRSGEFSSEKFCSRIQELIFNQA